MFSDDDFASVFLCIFIGPRHQQRPQDQVRRGTITATNHRDPIQIRGTNPTLVHRRRGMTKIKDRPGQIRVHLGIKTRAHSDHQDPILTRALPGQNHRTPSPIPIHRGIKTQAPVAHRDLIPIPDRRGTKMKTINVHRSPALDHLRGTQVNDPNLNQIHPLHGTITRSHRAQSTLKSDHRRPVPFCNSSRISARICKSC